MYQNYLLSNNMGGLKRASGLNNTPNIKQIMSINPIFNNAINKKNFEKKLGVRTSVESHGATGITETLENAYTQENAQHHHNSFHQQPSQGISTEFNEYVDGAFSLDTGTYDMLMIGGPVP